MEEDENNNIEIEASKDKKKTPTRLRLALKLQEKLTNSEVQVKGWENLESIPDGSNIIFATTHIADTDITTAAAELCDRYDIAMTNMSLHHDMPKEPSTYMAISLAGIANFLPIRYEKTADGKKSFFNPDDFSTIKDTMESGKAIVMAAHNPSGDKWALPRGGYSVPYVSSLAENDVYIVPISVNLNSETPTGTFETKSKTVLGRPKSDMYIGEPIMLDKIENISEFEAAMKKYLANEELSPEERMSFRDVKGKLREQSDVIMQSLSQHLPENKRGYYEKLTVTESDE